MRLPEIRYPLFWIIGLLALSGVGRLVWPLSEPLRASVREAWTRYREGPPVPSSRVPRRLLGPFAERVLMLAERTPAYSTPLPGAAMIDTIGRRVFADVYDTWPLTTGPSPSHFRIGNERPFGWVEASAVLPWSTRLAVRILPSGDIHSEASTGSAIPEAIPPGSVLPVVETDGDRWRIAYGADLKGWSDLTARFWIPPESADATQTGVLLSRDELVALLRRTLAADTPEIRLELRILAVFGRVFENPPLSHDDQIALRAFLPAAILANRIEGPGSASARLSEFNADWTSDLTLSGIPYRFVPLDVLP